MKQQKLIRLKFLLEDIEQGWSPECDNTPAEGDQWGVLKAGCTNGERFNPAQNKRLPEGVEPVTELEVKRGDILMSRANTTELLGSASYVHETPPRLLLCDKIYRLKVNTAKIDGRFLVSFLRSNEARKQMEAEASGSSASMQNIGQDTVRNLWVPLVECTIQKRIANYLDRETAEIDELIGEKEGMLTLLEEKRSALISHLVTRGVNAKVTLKDSGFPWLGSIPKHWPTQRSKRLLIERDERSVTGEEEMLTVSHLTGVTKRSVKDVNMFEADSNEGYKCCSPGDLAINTLWAWMGAMGVSQDEGIVSPAYHVYRITDDLLPAYVDALVRTPAFVAEVTRFSKGVWSSRLRLYPEGLYEVWLPVPPLKEQAAIVETIQQEKTKSGVLESALRDSITLLKERRAALITAAVTG